ncbi:MFS general substrate transporter [Sodiomyces alkalinus F11]|uniref:MFS general substrate transporter n=1 Tax=Sodiomyces alkalinus (strain CBS 110278 / VKM F-3762 / F11) TaxID=1314773 RepID=A0A3N2Q0Q3_SODAK|nr:MFS general substrate transporter [Sodiomyces alkalinus F11]ROT40343.1 MFS general substrate transporter [Sodiomyces alkalinus F11]
MGEITKFADVERTTPSESIAEGKVTGVADERARQLAQLPDPDEGKSDEERAEIDRKLVRKIDLWLIPWLSLLYLLSFLDRTNIGNARLAGLEPDLNMTGANYNMALSIFFISYAAFEPTTNALLKSVTPRVFFTAIVVIWGTIMTLMGLVTNYHGLLAARFFLGIAEAGLFPGVSYYLSYWYKSSEVGLRIAVFFSAAALAGSFGGLLAAAIAKMDGIGGKAGWAWIFILEGAVTVFFGLLCWRMVFNWPATARFLSEEDRIRVQRRIISDRQGATADHFDRRHIWAALRDWQSYGYMCLNAGSLTPIYAFSLFLPTILRGMGHQGTTAQLLSVPPYALASMTTVAVGYIADRTRQRGLMSMICAVVGMTGFAMMLGSNTPSVKYVGTFLGAAGVYPTCPNTLSWTVNNTEGPIKRGIVVGLVVGWANLNGIVASNIYLVREAPRFWTGHGVVLGYQFFFLFCASAVMHICLKTTNKRRREGKMDAQWEAMSQDERYIAGDKRPDFVYVT